MISIFNLNIMHGRNRKSAVFPPRLSRDEIQGNLQKIVDCVREYNPDFVTLQEVDEGSILSGSFNQFEWLAQKLHYPYTHFAPSCRITLFGKKIFVSGQAILSRYPLKNSESYRFDFSFPNDRMGFMVADAQLAGGATLTLASVHLVWLDWLHRNPRERQLKLIGSVIATKKNTVVIAGDFNCDLTSEESSLRYFLKQLNLKAYQPDSKNSLTSPSWNPTNRIDWILTSSGGRFLSHETLPNQLSDHLAIFATISL